LTKQCHTENAQVRLKYIDIFEKEAGGEICYTGNLILSKHTQIENALEKNQKQPFCMANRIQIENILKDKRIKKIKEFGIKAFSFEYIHIIRLYFNLNQLFQ